MLIDVPSDIQSEQIVFNYPDAVNLPSYRPTYKGNAKQIKQAVGVIERASKPILYVGGGAIASGATEEPREAFDHDEDSRGDDAHGQRRLPGVAPDELGSCRYARLEVREPCHDRVRSIIAAGARFSDRVTGKLSEFAPHAKVIHIDIDPAEIGKIREAQVPIVGDRRASSRASSPRSRRKPARRAPRRGTRRSRNGASVTRSTMRRSTENPDEIVPEIAMQKLSAKLDPHNSVVVTEVGQHQMWAAQFIDREEPRSFISSGGLGTMGFGFPASIGAAFGRPGAQVVCIAGDGSFQMNSQEMATAAIHNVPVKVVIMDNRALGMVHQWQKAFL